MKRGEIWIVNLEPGFGREIHKRRPCLIISSPDINSRTFNKIIIPTSSQVPKQIGEEMVEIGKEAGLDQSSVLLPVYMRSIDQDRLIKKIGTISEEKLEEVEEALRLVLDLEDEN